ncbi:MAG: hypothetical protein CVV42_16720 [Candidatus Riflebacteria bacterium HGW-Riflebacteria-2]|jgi:hypothetical protein|nr:MAG: hypothetical protein CVV42_16720 [Candidatus Riflebacteria bacterium HGW-Riflebacteria-2]
MKKCSIYLDALEKGTSEDASSWQDVLMHANRCPDCATDMKRRGEMFEIMADMPEPEYPSVLHSAIMSGIADANTRSDGSDETGWFARIFDRLLQPVEMAISLACLVMFTFLMQIDHSSPLDIRPTRSNAGRQLAARGEPRQAVSSQTLETVSAAEVDQFLRQLEDFNRSQHGHRQPQIDYTPELRLVNDLSNRR